MLQYFQTTTMILAWSIGLSFCWAVAVFLLPARFSPRKKTINRQIILPTLLFAPIVLFLFHKYLNINLIFPVVSISNIESILLATLAPSVVLCFATGLFFSITLEVRTLKETFYASNFATFYKALGLSLKRKMFKLILSKSMIDCWKVSLPWIFGEIIIVEALFNAHGLGLEIWHAARMRDLENFSVNIAWLMTMYVVLGAVASFLSKRMGERLSDYGV